MSLRSGSLAAGSGQAFQPDFLLSFVSLERLTYLELGHDPSQGHARPEMPPAKFPQMKYSLPKGEKEMGNSESGIF